MNKHDVEQLVSAFLMALASTCKDAVKAGFAEMASQPRYPEHVAIKQASEITGYSKNSLYQMNYRGQVPGAHKIGGKLMFETAVLQEWVRSGATPNAR